FFGEASLSAWWSHHNGSVARSRLSAIRDFGFTFARALEYQEFPSAQPTVWFDSQPDFPLITTQHLDIHSSINCCRITQTHHSANQNMYAILNSKIRSAKLISIFLRPSSSSADSRGYHFLSIVLSALQRVKRKLNFLHDKTPRLSLVPTLSYHSNSPLTKPKHVRHSQLKGVVGLANHELLSRLAWTAFSLDLDVTSSIVDRDAETTK
ncbi:hypothetical protein PSHT_07684, partial [Puccinia striiformis]